MNPLQNSQRSEILDILRGFALLWICVANYPGFALYNEDKPELVTIMPAPFLDKIINFCHYAFVDGKFYSLFSLLFGIGFAIIITKSSEHQNKNLWLFYKRIIILMLFGLAHLMLLWTGDILLLYGMIGLVLPLFRKLSNKTLITLWICLILSPIAIDGLKVVSDGKINIAKPVFEKAIKISEESGITEDNHQTWPLVKKDYGSLLVYLKTGVLFRYGSLLNSNRFVKVLGMFILGFYVGRNRLYQNLDTRFTLLKKVRFWGFAIGLPFSLLMAYLEIYGNRDSATAYLLNTISYAFGVVPLSLAYTATLCLLYWKTNWYKRLVIFKPVGKMALTNYILQTVFGIVIFYGIGLGLGTQSSLLFILLVSVCVFLLEIILSSIWLKFFNYGPLEWLWRQVTYGKKIRIIKELSVIE